MELIFSKYLTERYWQAFVANVILFNKRQKTSFFHLYSLSKLNFTNRGFKTTEQLCSNILSNNISTCSKHDSKTSKANYKRKKI